MEKIAELDEFKQGIDKFCEDEELNNETASQLKNAILTDVGNLTKAAMSKSAQDEGAANENEDTKSSIKQVLELLRGGVSSAADWAKENKDISVPLGSGLAGVGAATGAKGVGLYAPSLAEILGVGALGAGAGAGIQHRDKLLALLGGGEGTPLATEQEVLDIVGEPRDAKMKRYTGLTSEGYNEGAATQTYLSDLWDTAKDVPGAVIQGTRNENYSPPVVNAIKERLE